MQKNQTYEIFQVETIINPGVICNLQCTDCEKGVRQADRRLAECINKHQQAARRHE